MAAQRRGIRVRAAGGVEARVEDGHWTGDPDLVAIAVALEGPGIGAQWPDPDWRRATMLAEAIGGKVLDPARASPRPPKGAVE